MKKQNRGKWEKVGVIGVDAGLCWIGDPCYILHNKEHPKAIGNSWHEFCDKLFPRDDYTKRSHQLNYDDGYPGLGVVVSTGGDGEYNVEVFKTKNGEIKELRVVFIEENEEGEY